MTPAAPGARVGVLGAGQLGRMLAMAAARMGLRPTLYAPEADPPAADVAPTVRGAWDDAAALRAWAEGLAVVTTEFENVPAETLAAVAAVAPVAPSAAALATAQDRLVEKRFLQGAGLTVAPFEAVDDRAGLDSALARIGRAAILKTRRLGYDGKGQARLEGAEDADAAWVASGDAPCVLEGVAAFARELSVVAARGRDGAVAAYDPAENIHEGGVLRRSLAPGSISAETAAAAQAIAARVLTALDYVGVVGVELFEMPDGALWVNEIAPRVHNTGHWTIEACAVDQFTQHMRAVCGWPLGATTRHADAEMTNLLGEEAADWARLAAEPHAALHLYGKREARPGRKMGHVTRVRPRKLS